jgi:hypothetical protein
MSARRFDVKKVQHHSNIGFYQNIIANVNVTRLFCFDFFFALEDFYSNLSNKLLYWLYISGLQLNSEKKKNIYIILLYNLFDLRKYDFFPYEIKCESYNI